MTVNDRPLTRPLTPQARRRLIEAPITFHTVPPHPHGGTLIVTELPTAGRRRPHSWSTDESYYGGTSDDTLESLVDLLRD